MQYAVAWWTRRRSSRPAFRPSQTLCPLCLYTVLYYIRLNFFSNYVLHRRHITYDAKGTSFHQPVRGFP